MKSWRFIIVGDCLYSCVNFDKHLLPIPPEQPALHSIQNPVNKISVSCFSPNSVCRASVRSGKSGCLVKLDAVNYSPLAGGHKVDTNNSLIILEKGCYLDHYYHRHEKAQLFPIKHIHTLGYVCNKPFVRDGVLMGRKLLDVVSSQGSKQQKFERIRGTS